MELMNVLSLFDGMGAGRLALKRAGIMVGQYFASEVDPYAIAVTQHNFPDVIQLGKVEDFSNWYLPDIDFLIGGPPCQGLSVAGNQLNFSDSRSKLFFFYVLILNAIKPTYFLMENVNMKKEWANQISDLLEVEPIRINSSLVSAQLRDRLYWTNIPDIEQPRDQGIMFQDIVESGRVATEKAFCLDASYYKGGGEATRKRQRERSQRSSVFTGVNSSRWMTPKECERLQTFPDNYSLVPHPKFKNREMSKTQRYKMLGNSFTVDVITHIIKNVGSVGTM
jgi:DNA (cytosine-5)-methyltransferase 3A